MKIHPAEVELFHADGRMEVQKDGDSHDEATSRFSQFD